MRKIVAFVASNFRKDKIWLHRTRPSRRECEVVVAVDNSSSMADAGVRRMAFMAVATLMQGLSVLEIGKMGLLRDTIIQCCRELFNHSSSSVTLAKIFKQPCRTLYF